jgi:uncharacterized protein YcgI (DUF1989 family)
MKKNELFFPSLQDLRSSSEFCDVTLATDESEVRAHRVILSACSPHLREVLKRHATSNNQNLLIYLRFVACLAVALPLRDYLHKL